MGGQEKPISLGSAGLVLGRPAVCILYFVIGRLGVNDLVHQPCPTPGRRNDDHPI